ncbi:MAG: beta-lactamase family protein [Gemmatimonadetes bacterium]|nr:beta-lactamase family protein [Gemmatimonadota bacterium]
MDGLEDWQIDDDSGEVTGAPEDEAPALRRFSTRRKVVAVAMLFCFAAALAYPFLFWPRVRYFFSTVPQMPGRDVADEAPQTVVAPAALATARTIVEKEVRRGAFPGAALAVGVKGRVVMETGVGRTGWGRLAAPVDVDATLYDLASLTKIVGTTAAVMALVDDGKMSLDDRVSRYLPHFTGGGREKVTVRQLLTHTAGLPAAVPVEGASPGDRLFNLVAHVKLIAEPGENVLYSDVGFVILGLAASNAAHEPLGSYLRKRVWAPLGMTETRFEPGRPCDACAPTLTLDDGTPFAGETNDPFSRKLGGITGNAGLFSTGHDVARFAAMIANGGELDGVRVIRASTLAAFMRPQPGAGLRGLGFEAFCREGTQPDQKPCKTAPYAYGHTGYTGTSMWIDPERGIWVVLLANRTYLPRAPNHIRKVRRDLFNTVTGFVPPPVPADTADTAEAH